MSAVKHQARQRRKVKVTREVEVATVTVTVGSSFDLIDKITIFPTFSI